MKHTIISISGSQIVVTKGAGNLLKKYIRKVRFLTIFRPAERVELLDTLRDILLESGTQPVSKSVAQKSVDILGSPSFANRVRSPEAYQTVRRVTRNALRFLKPKHILIIRKIFFLSLALVFAVAFGLTMASYRSQYSAQPSDSTLLTNLGTVVLSQPPDQGVGKSDAWALVAALAVLIGLFLAALALSKPNKGTKYYVAVLAVLSAFALYRPPLTTTDANMHHSIYPGNPDKLSACGDMINTVVIENANTLFYNLYDQGFRLQKELANDPALGVPNRAAICDSYNALRTEHAADNIILLSYVKNKEGQPVPFDYERYYNPQVRGVGVPEIRYGYFVL